MQSDVVTSSDVDTKCDAHHKLF